ncbi:MAG TPA: hypothetical protein PLF42_01090 [Anaerolineales bacterium]|nr:hypothetical protein [Anaerolineales bacterium]
MKQHGGITTLSEADLLLESGNYRALNQSEREKLFPRDTEMVDQKVSSSQIRHFPDEIFPISPIEFEEILIKAKAGPQPAWTHVVVFIIRKITDRVSVFALLRALLWLWLWIIAYRLVAPSLQWSLITGVNSLKIAGVYAAGALVLPLLIGAMTNTNKEIFWRERKLSRSPILRLYTHQGAYVGFHVGYFVIFFLTSVQNLFTPHFIHWVEFIKVAFPILMGYAGARLIPHNLWVAYGRLHLRDGGIFFFFALLGPLWAWFLLEVYKKLASPVTAAISILAAITILVFWNAWKNRKTEPSARAA